MPHELGSFGVWAREADLDGALVQELERLGYGTVWIGGSPDGALRTAEVLLGATTHLRVATGIVNIWQDDARTVAASHRRLMEASGGRFLLGIGVGHPEATSDYRRPYGALVDYLDVLDGEGVPEQERVLAALGPKVLRLSADRTAGAHPYLTTPQHTREAREILGAGVLLAPEQKVVLESDPDKARAIGRPPVAKPYLGLSNYLNNLRRLGWDDAELADGGSDALIDALVAHGDPATVAGRLREHLDAGADHVAVQLLTGSGADPMPGYRALAAALELAH